MRTLIIGLGQIGMGYDLQLDPGSYVYTHARAFQQHPRYSLVGAVDADLSRCEIFEEHYGYPAFHNLEKALQITKPDVIAISTPTQTHGSILRTIFASVKPIGILCEKPLSYDIEEARRMVDECRSHNCRLYVNYIRCSDPGIIEVKKRLSEGAICSPIKGIAWYSKGLIHNGSHFFNLFQYWLGAMMNFKVIETGRLWNGIDPEPDLQVEFERGTIYFLSAREEDYSHYTIELVTSNGRLRLEQSGEQIIWQSAVKDMVIDGYTVLSSTEERIETNMMRYQWNVIDQLALSMDGLAGNVCTGNEALKTLASLDKIKSSLM